MGNVKLCDCTLSASEVYFTSKELDDILDDLQDAGADVIELGLACQKNFRINSCLFYDAEELDAFQDEHKAHLSNETIYSILLDTQRIPEDLMDFDRRVLIRAQIWPGHEEDNLTVCRQMTQRGFRLILCPMETTMISDTAFARILEAAVQMKAVGVYVVDRDQLDVEKSLARLKEADRVLPSRMLLGYHATDCTGEAMETAKKIVALSMERTVLLDASVCGLSNRAGMLRSEMFADQLNELCGGDYRQEGFFAVYDHALSKRFREVVLLRYLSAKYRCSHRYAEYYHNEVQATLVACAEILKTMPDELRWNFSKKDAYRLFRTYTRQQMDLAVIIPTCNRASAIDSLLFQSAYQLRKYGVDIIIYDSSEDDKTENLVRNFQLDGCWNVIYRRYEGSFDGFSLDHKIMDAYRDYLEQYQYLWVCRDGLIITPDTCMRQLCSYIQKGIDCIIVDAKFRNGDEESETVYGDGEAQSFFQEQCIRMATLGTLIFSSKLIRTILEQIPLNEQTYSLWQMAAPLHYYAMAPFSVVGYIGEVFFYNTAGTANSFWNKAGKAMEQWAYRWYTVVTELPACYDAAKEEVLKIDMYDFHPFYLNSLMRMRGNGGLSVKIVRHNKEYLSHVSDTALWKYYAVALMPRWSARFLVDHQEGRIFRWLRKIYLLVERKEVE